MTKNFAFISERADVSPFLHAGAVAREIFAFAGVPDLEPSLLEANWQGWEDAGCIFYPAAVPSRCPPAPRTPTMRQGAPIARRVPRS